MVSGLVTAMLDFEEDPANAIKMYSDVTETVQKNEVMTRMPKCSSDMYMKHLYCLVAYKRTFFFFFFL